MVNLLAGIGLGAILGFLMSTGLMFLFYGFSDNLDKLRQSLFPPGWVLIIIVAINLGAIIGAITAIRSRNN